jgi:hypothetical protein
MRRGAVALLVPALLAAACAERRPGSVADPQAPPAAESPPPDQGGELAGASCRNVNAGNPANFPEFVDVELESENGVDRVTFVFEPASDAPDRPPFHFVSFVDQLITDGEGETVEVEGQAFVMVSFQAIGVDLSSETPVEVYTGPKRFTPGYGTLKELVHLGDFEGQVSWGLGLGSKECFVLDAQADHITLEFASA